MSVNTIFPAFRATLDEGWYNGALVVTNDTANNYFSKPDVGHLGTGETQQVAVDNCTLTIGGTSVGLAEASAIVHKVAFYLATGGAVSYTSPSGVTVTGSGFTIGNTFANISVAGNALTQAQAQSFVNLVGQFIVTESSS